MDACKHAYLRVKNNALYTPNLEEPGSNRRSHMLAAIIAGTLASLAGITASNGAPLTTIILAALAITAAAPLTIRWRRQPTPREAIRRAVNTSD